PDLPLKRLIADSYAAMQPPDAIWKLYLVEIARLEDNGRVTAEEYYVLRHSLAAKATLMDLTHGDPTAFTEGTVQEVLQVAKETLRADLNESLLAEQARRREAERTIGEMQESEARRKQGIHNRSTRIAVIASRILLGLIVVALLLALGYSFPWNLPRLKVAWFSYFISGLLLFLFALSMANLVWGTTVKSMVGRFETRLAEWLRARIRES